jgi:hypothetical protein
MDGPFVSLPFFLGIRLQRGVVSAIKPGGVEVTLNVAHAQEEACLQCGRCTGPKGPPAKVFIPLTSHGFSPGERVTVTRAIPDSGWASSFVFGVPLLFALAALWAWNYFSVSPRHSLLPVLAFLAALMIGFAAIGWVDSSLRKKYPPAIDKLPLPECALENHG